MSLLELEGVEAGYLEGSVVLEGVSLEVEAGSVVSLLGRNGVGKTTTLRTITGLLEPRAGTITFNGEDITGLPPYEIYGRGVGHVVEDRGIFPKLTVRENLEVPITDSQNEYRLDKLYDFFPVLRELSSSEGRNLSGGEQQMLAIARTIRANPDLLLLDEPSEGLAPQIVDDVVESIEYIVNDGTTVLIVEQNSKLALDLASYNYIMDKGQIVLEGTSDKVREERELLQKYLGIA